ncbi:hypothetical protein HYFRA_00003834 [Hymenoscyphus fraxineus]|uniref:BTB domain-containing protein n=1 Tax=Hymenoscyphus fraxineus TaxID=746836 RepID=A0A9N9PJZ8_9HELO|nr:hypothetical protein HYFRA_00003834 [Hymenoscyphus fraxineus]
MSSEENPTAESLSSVLSPLLASGKYSDMKMLCGSRVFDAHINIVCSHSKEANERQVDLPENDPHAVGKMLDYLYTHQYDAEETGASLILHARLYVCGDKYDIPGLKSLSKQKYLEVLKTYYQHAVFGQSLGIIYYDSRDRIRILGMPQ